MTTIDWIIVAAYMVVTLALGVWLARRASGSMEDFFVGGRALPWWLAGTSMAATTFSIDTPLYISGLVGNRGIAGNWEWWNFAIAHVILIYIFAKMWRRAEIVTDNELTEIRYAGTPAAALRATKGFLFAVVVGSIGIGYAMLAMVKVIDALEIFPGLGLTLGDSGKLWSVIAVSVLVLAYAGLAGLWGVVATDFFQFFLGLVGAVLVAVFAVNHVGGLDEMVRLAQQNTDFDVLSFTPLTFGEGGFLGVGWSSVAQISGWTFVAYMVLQWWAFRRSDGGGEFIQRLAAARDERDAERAAWFFNILNYVVRTWPWIVVAVVALVVYPELEDRELGYPKLMLDFLPAGLLGVVVASLLAAFMSTVSTLINWSASYITHDLYARFLRPRAGQRELILFARVASVLVTALGATAAFFSQDIGTVFRLIIAIGTGPGLVLILRWFWWRINAWAELAAMVAGFLVGFATSVWTGVDVTLFGATVSVPPLRIADFGIRLMVTSLATVAVWVPVMLLTRPEPDEKLDEFYRRVRPGGPGWSRQRARTGLSPAQDLGRDAQRVLAALLILFGAMFAVGGLVMLRLGVFAAMAVMAVLGWAWLSRLRDPGDGGVKARV
ncbi:MAG TPA: sodium:solute symporter family protein [Longimicrobiales bacterium]|nr:sodium:solute symporter family protein [Longimicrobiales bacterium]